MTNKAFYGVPAIHSIQQPRQRPHTCQFQSHNISFSVKIIIICLCWCWISKRLIQNKKNIYLTSEITWLWWYSWQHSKNHFLDLTGPGQVYILYRYILTYYLCSDYYPAGWSWVLDFFWQMVGPTLTEPSFNLAIKRLRQITLRWSSLQSLLLLGDHQIYKIKAVAKRK